MYYEKKMDGTEPVCMVIGWQTSAKMCTKLKNTLKRRGSNRKMAQ